MRKPVQGEPILDGAKRDFGGSFPTHLVGILVWKEFAGAPTKSTVLNVVMFVLFVAGLACLIQAGA